MSLLERVNAVLVDVKCERADQELKFGADSAASPKHDPAYALSILVEEVGEAAQELNDARWKAKTPEQIAEFMRRARRELVQVAAVAVAMCEAIDVTCSNGAPRP